MREKQERRRRAHELRAGPLAPFLVGKVLTIDDERVTLPEASQSALVAVNLLEYALDYRGTLQDWFRAVAVGGHLVVVVSHAFLRDRQLAPRSHWDTAKRRLYTPRSLMDEVEEALAPNSYRLRYLGDDDRGYDYALDAELEPVGNSDLLLALEKIAVPAWGLEARVPTVPRAAAPDYGFAPARTRIEVASSRPRRRILLLKLDHLGDFVMSLPALEKVRVLFADAEVTLVVGSWNAGIARATNLADVVIAFDAFPRNSSEEDVDVHARAALFAAAVTGVFDIAIDLRVDHDTRSLLRKIDARLRAGIGTRAQHSFLDIFLPIDGTRNEYEIARDDDISHHHFAAQPTALRNEYRIQCVAETDRHNSAIVWGPYRPLRPGRYFFEPRIELARDTRGGALIVDVGLDMRSVVQRALPSSEQPLRLPFTVERSGAAFEFRIWAVVDQPPVDFSFYGGRLVREGASSVLHQADYMRLLVELVRMRVEEDGVLADTALV